MRTQSNLTSQILKAIIIAVPFVVFAIAAWSFRHQQSFTSDGRLHLTDFSYHAVIFSAALRDDQFSSWRFTDQVAALESHFGFKPSSLLMVGMSPVAELLLGGLTVLSQNELAVSYLLWIGGSLAVLVWGVVSVARTFRPGGAELTMYVGSALALLSDTGFQTLYLGQTSILATGVLLLVIASRSSRTSPVSLGSVLLFSLLAIKPHYLLIGVSFLVADRRWRLLLSSLVAMLLTLVAYLGFRGVAPVIDYLHQLLGYMQPLEPQYAGTYWRAGIPSISGLLSPGLFAHMGNLLGGAFLIGAMLLALLLFVRRRYVGCIPILTLSAILLGLPYHGVYEHLLLLLLFPWVAALPGMGRLVRQVLWVTVLVLLLANVSVSVSFIAMVVLFIASATCVVQGAAIHSGGALPNGDSTCRKG